LTAQISDVVVFRRRSYRLAGVSGSGLFDPSEVGLEARSTSTASWRGFHCEYAVEGSQLVLDTVHIGLEQPSKLFTREPAWDERAHCWVFDSLGHPISFTGGLLLGEGFIEDLYIHMGFHPTWKYETVLELEFRNGQLTQVADQSEAARQFRSTLQPGDLKPGAGTGPQRIQE
jgi:hypothetical protein